MDDDPIVCEFCECADPEYTDTDIWVCAGCAEQNNFNMNSPEVNGFRRFIR